jgi:tetratricopeptide (TPR) repeat protein
VRAQRTLDAAAPVRAPIAALAAASLCAILGGLLAGCAGGIDPTPDEVVLSPRQKAWYAERRIHDALLLRAEGRLDAAERQLRLGLTVVPDHPQVHRTLALVLEDLGRAAEAESHWQRADALDPPAQRPSEAALGVAPAGVLVALVPPPTRDVEAERIPQGWPSHAAAATLVRAIEARLPGAEVAFLDPASVSDARAELVSRSAAVVLSLRTDRVFCGTSGKEGPFAVVWLRGAAATSERMVAAPAVERAGPLDWRRRARCPDDPLVELVDDRLRSAELREALDAPRSARGGWPAPVLRSLFPGLADRIADEIDTGRRLLAVGQVEPASAAFRRALAIDPDDANTRAYLREAESTLAMLKELGVSQPEPATSMPELEPGFSEAQRAAAEAVLAEERRDRDELLAQLALAEGDQRLAPSPEILAGLRAAESRPPSATGQRLAAARGGAEVEARALHGEARSVLVTYFFRLGEADPILSERDSNGDGRADEWTAYSGGFRSEQWRDARGDGIPRVHVAYGPAGEEPRAIEIDDDADGRPERIFRYAGARLERDERDSDGDGRIDLRDAFDPEGRVAVREEDLDGDGEIDLVTHYEGGKLTRREVRNPALLDRLERRAAH